MFVDVVSVVCYWVLVLFGIDIGVVVLLSLMSGSVIVLRCGVLSSALLLCVGACGVVVVVCVLLLLQV